MDHFKGVPTFEAHKDLDIVSFLVEASIASSKREAREFVSAGSIQINGEKITDEGFIVDEGVSIGGILLVKRGKKKYFIGKF